jgi:hypothetical protein
MGERTNAGLGASRSRPQGRSQAQAHRGADLVARLTPKASATLLIVTLLSVATRACSGGQRNDWQTGLAMVDAAKRKRLANLKPFKPE